LLAIYDTNETGTIKNKKIKIEDLRQLESIGLPTNDFSGTIVRLTAGESIDAGETLYLGGVTAGTTGGRVYKARSFVNNTKLPCMGIAVTTQTTTGSSVDVLLMGTVEFSAFTFNDGLGATGDNGKVVYLSTAQGELSVTAPNVAGQQVQVLGIVISGKQMLFNPDYNIIQL